ANSLSSLGIGPEYFGIDSQRDHIVWARTIASPKEHFADRLTKADPSGTAFQAESLDRAERRRIAFGNVLSSRVNQRPVARHPCYLRAREYVGLFPAMDQIPLLFHQRAEILSIRHPVNPGAQPGRYWFDSACLGG